MRFATLPAPFSSFKLDPTPGTRARCPLCGGEVVAKCGKVKVWHWAHMNRRGDCDDWYEPESPWHRRWKSYYPPEWQEVTLAHPSGTDRHRADVSLPHTDGRRTVLEFQRSQITIDTLRAREQFYRQFGQMIWVLDGSQNRIANNFAIYPNDKPGLFNFRWKRQRVWMNAGQPIYIHGIDAGEKRVEYREWPTGYNHDGHYMEYNSTTTARYDVGQQNPDRLFLIERYFDTGYGYGKFTDRDEFIHRSGGRPNPYPTDSP